MTSLARVRWTKVARLIFTSFLHLPKNVLYYVFFRFYVYDQEIWLEGDKVEATIGITRFVLVSYIRCNIAAGGKDHSV